MTDPGNPLIRENLPCPRCGYNLRGMTVCQCPECGESFDPEHLEPVPRTRVPLPWHALLGPVATGTALLVTSVVFRGLWASPAKEFEFLFIAGGGTLAVAALYGGYVARLAVTHPTSDAFPYAEFLSNWICLAFYNLVAGIFVVWGTFALLAHLGWAK